MWKRNKKKGEERSMRRSRRKKEAQGERAAGGQEHGGDPSPSLQLQCLAPHVTAPWLLQSSGLAGLCVLPPLPLSTFPSSLPASLPRPKLPFTTWHGFGTIQALGPQLSSRRAEGPHGACSLAYFCVLSHVDSVRPHGL